MVQQRGQAPKRVRSSSSNSIEKSGITLKKQKCSFAVPRINVLGHIVSSEGIQPDEVKIRAVSAAPRPKYAAEVRSFLGLTNYCSRYIKNYSITSHTLYAN